MIPSGNLLVSCCAAPYCCSLKGSLGLFNCIRFTHSFCAKETCFNSRDADPRKACTSSPLDDMAGIGIQCLALFLGSTEIKENLCQLIQVETSNKYFPDEPAQVTTKLLRCTVRSNKFMEVLINPPIKLPNTTGSAVLITAQVQNFLFCCIKAWTGAGL